MTTIKRTWAWITQLLNNVEYKFELENLTWIKIVANGIAYQDEF